MDDPNTPDPGVDSVQISELHSLEIRELYL